MHDDLDHAACCRLLAAIMRQWMADARKSQVVCTLALAIATFWAVRLFFSPSEW